MLTRGFPTLSLSNDGKLRSYFDVVSTCVRGITISNYTFIIHLHVVLHHSPTSDKNGRITQHYRFALTNVFGRYTDAGDD